MNDDIAIKVSNLSKVYHLYNQPQDRLKEALHPLRKSYHHDFYAMDDVSFEIKKGETVGIVGKNGAGKSTLLKMITGVLMPSSGDIEVDGKIASILELGAGFNPDMSGIENIYLNGTIMGFSREEMEAKIEGILDFADIGEFIYQPIKSYSSGMLARLAFSVAINVDADILIVDEALSVGDISFQSKSMTKMKSMMNCGTTVLFVSHDIGAIQSLCKEVIFIDNGKMVAYDQVDLVTSLYLREQQVLNNIELKNNSFGKKAINNNEEEMFKNFSMDLSEDRVFKGTRSGNHKAHILNFKFLNEKKIESDSIESNSKYFIQISVKFDVDLDSFAIVCPIRNLAGTQEIGVSSSVEKFVFPSVKKDEIYFIEIESIMNLKDGIYNLVLSIEAPIVENQIHEFVDVLENCHTFSVYWGELRFPTKFYTKGDIRYFKKDVNS